MLIIYTCVCVVEKISIINDVLFIDGQWHINVIINLQWMMYHIISNKQCGMHLRKQNN